MKTSLSELRARIPGAASVQWPEGERYALGFSQGCMSLGYYAPRGHDPQQPHRRDEIYIVQSGSAELIIDGACHPCRAGDALFVGAGVAHRFERISADFATWVVFCGAAKTD